MANKGLENTHPIIIKCAALATGISASSFRAKDVLFHIELIKNILSPTPFAHDFDVQYTQVMRLFEKYHDRGWVNKEATDSGKPLFSFNEKGFVAIIDSMMHLDRQLPVSEVLFTQAFFDSYKDYMLGHVFDSEKLNAEEKELLKRCLTPYYLLKQQIKIIEKGINDVKFRIAESTKLMAFIDQNKDKSSKELVKSLPSEFSYRLSYLKPFREWLGNLPDRLLEHELDRGFEVRNKHYYQKNLTHLDNLKKYYEDCCKE